MSSPSSQEADALTEAARYRLLSIEATCAPEGCVGRDWFVYRITQGENVVTGYRQGSRDKVGAEVETILTGLNARRDWGKSKPVAKRGRMVRGTAEEAVPPKGGPAR